MNGPRRPGPGAPARAPAAGPAPAPRRIGLATKIGLLLGLLIMGKVASMARRGPVGTEELRLIGIVLGEILLLIVALVNVNFVFYVLVFYLPFSQMLPGDYGTAVNITNVLVVIVVFGLFFRSIREGALPGLHGAGPADRPPPAADVRGLLPGGSPRRWTGSSS